MVMNVPRVQMLHKTNIKNSQRIKMKYTKYIHYLTTLNNSEYTVTSVLPYPIVQLDIF